MGKVGRHLRACNIGWGGKEIPNRSYEVLLGQGSWKKASGGFIPPGALKAGNESNRQPLFVCRVNYRGGVHVGKAARHLRACNIGWGGKEVSVRNYEVLIASEGMSQADNGAGWSQADRGRVPNNATVAGHEANKAQKLYVCRVSFRGGVHIGKVAPHLRACNIGYGGREIRVGRYEVLTKTGKWVPSAGGKVVPSALKAGKESNGTPLFICRANFKGGLHVGKVAPHLRACNIGWGGKENGVPKYEVFVAQ
uniref:Uncharacterized protein n=1 Tax=Magnetococcus massalia (strain MO-1) TaxID=451514 RepID=A0A1S7LGN4_MAGMO|nr:conserved protein of unknown function [include at least 3 DUF3421 domain] [Candidatus Magnetococcus massalia]